MLVTRHTPDTAVEVEGEGRRKQGGGGGCLCDWEVGGFLSVILRAYTYYTGTLYFLASPVYDMITDVQNSGPRQRAHAMHQKKWQTKPTLLYS
jgi:hypothetical protein